MIEQAKFTYSLYGKTFEKHTETTEDQGEKQIKAIGDNQKQLYNKQAGNNELLISEEREIFKNIDNRRLYEIDELSKTVGYGDLKFI